MKKTLTPLVLAILAAHTLCAQNYPPANANFVFNDNGLGGGTASSGTYAPGQSIVFDIYVHFAAPQPTNASGISYYFAARQGITGSGASAPGIFAITSREVSAGGQTSPWNSRISLGPIFPQAIDGANGNSRDLGAIGDVVLPSSTDIFVARLTISIAANAPLGLYTLQNLIGNEVLAHGSSINDNTGTSYSLPRTLYTVAIVPEPATTSLLVLTAAAAGAFVSLRGCRRRLVAASRAEQ